MVGKECNFRSRVYKVQTFLGVLAVLRKCMKSASCGHTNTSADIDGKIGI
jgi:hypothetical protein